MLNTFCLLLWRCKPTKYLFKWLKMIPYTCSCQSLKCRFGGHPFVFWQWHNGRGFFSVPVCSISAILGAMHSERPLIHLSAQRRLYRVTRPSAQGNLRQIQNTAFTGGGLRAVMCRFTDAHLSTIPLEILLRSPKSSVHSSDALCCHSLTLLCNLIHGNCAHLKCKTLTFL